MRKSIDKFKHWSTKGMFDLVPLLVEVQLIRILGARINHAENSNRRWGLDNLTSKINILKKT